MSRAMGGGLPQPSLLALLVLRRATAGAVPGADDDDEACHVLEPACETPLDSYGMPPSHSHSHSNSPGAPTASPPPPHAPDRVLIPEASMEQWSSLSLQLQRGLRAQVLGAAAGGGGCGGCSGSQVSRAAGSGPGSGSAASSVGGAVSMEEAVPAQSNALILAAGLVRELEGALGEGEGEGGRDGEFQAGTVAGTSKIAPASNPRASCRQSRSQHRLCCLRGVLALRLLEAATYGEKARGNSLAVAAAVVRPQALPRGAREQTEVKGASHNSHGEHNAHSDMHSNAMQRPRSLVSVLLGVTCLAGQAQGKGSWQGWASLPVEAELLALRVLSNATHHCPAAAAAVPRARPDSCGPGSAAAAVLVPVLTGSGSASSVAVCPHASCVPLDLREWPRGTQ